MHYNFWFEKAFKAKVDNSRKPLKDDKKTPHSENVVPTEKLVVKDQTQHHSSFNERVHQNSECSEGDDDCQKKDDVLQSKYSLYSLELLFPTNFCYVP